jgi:hypothetical protein
MICEASDFEGRHLVSSRNPAKIGPNAMLDFRMDPMDTIFGTEYQVIVERRIGICHLFAPSSATMILDKYLTNVTPR